MSIDASLEQPARSTSASRSSRGRATVHIRDEAEEFQEPRLTTPSKALRPPSSLSANARASTSSSSALRTTLLMRLAFGRNRPRNVAENEMLWTNDEMDAAIKLRQRYAIAVKCLPGAVFSTIIASIMLHMRWLQVSGQADYSDFFPEIAHPYACQVYGVVVGLTLVIRLSISISRWESGAEATQIFHTKWIDAFDQINAFLECSRRTHGDDVYYCRNTDKAQRDLVHYFSLLHALALGTLYYAQGQVLGHIPLEGQMCYQHWKYIPIINLEKAAKDWYLSEKKE